MVNSTICSACRCRTDATATANPVASATATTLTEVTSDIFGSIRAKPAPVRVAATPTPSTTGQDATAAARKGTAANSAT
ncbi:hypothetical protein GCM10011576_10130 [Micromonospora parathelypteridis]|nr:hypothetical protein GCM10011576_10130 [Micromonospora parathelypteridis]